MFVGIDFGTTNSAIGIAGLDKAAPEEVQLVQLPKPGGGTQSTWRTVLFFEQAGGKLSAGAPAIARYLETGGEGRLLQSIKSHLASGSFKTTQILGRRWALDDMIAAFLRQLRAASPIDLGKRAVVGRPVKYWGAEDEEDDARAIDRMQSALGKAGFEEVHFEYEPVGAAARYAAGLDHQELIVVADFGGGTTDFSVIRAGGKEAGTVLATGGIGVSGDAFDARIIDAVVAPALGRGTNYSVDAFSGDAPVPAWIYGHLRRWHYLSFLKEEQTMRLLDRVQSGAREPKKIDKLIRVVDEDLGLVLHRAVEGAKVRLSDSPEDRVTLEQIELDLPVLRTGFESWIAEDLEVIGKVLDEVLAKAGVTGAQIDKVFATGGSSLVPAVRNALSARFGAEKLVGGEELTSVAWGLAARARQIWG
ncbi:MAG TPA: Hsp70 family protein [Kofleriaceae bacterium]|jgi:hypothetical chaperone protein